MCEDLQMAQRDSADKTLADYPRPSVAVDTAVLTVRDGRLCVVLVEDGRRLPGTFLHEGETLADAVDRALLTKAGLRGEHPTQLHVFDDPGRDERGWVLSVAHLVAVPALRLEELPAGVVLTRVTGVGTLDFDHNQILDLAVERLRADYRYRPDPGALLDEPFTLRELQHLHEGVAGQRLMRDTFRRRMEPQLVATGDYHRGSVGMPARTFVRPRDEIRAER